jgi:hypothetical protein
MSSSLEALLYQYCKESTSQDLDRETKMHALQQKYAQISWSFNESTAKITRSFWGALLSIGSAVGHLPIPKLQSSPIKAFAELAGKAGSQVAENLRQSWILHPRNAHEITGSKAKEAGHQVAKVTEKVREVWDTAQKVMSHREHLIQTIFRN